VVVGHGGRERTNSQPKKQRSAFGPTRSGLHLVWRSVCSARMTTRLGIDTGGTFTDIVTIDGEGAIRLTKVPSSRPGDPGGIIAGIEQELGRMDEVDVFIHGTTMATNALIEKKGARC